MADVLTGKVDPSGKLPLTFPRSVGQILAANPEQYPGVDGTAHYTEGIDVGYHIYAARDIKPLFPFGFGLSYTTFSFCGLKVTHAPDSHTTAVSFTVTNTGKFAGAEVAQLYLGLPPITEGNEQPIQLKGFRRMMLNSGQSKTVTLTLDARSFSFWLVSSHEWKITQGTIQVMVGDFSANKPLKSTLSVRLELDPTWPPKSEGFSYFEGYFFRHPEKMRVRGVQSNRTVFLRLLAAISRRDLDWKEIEEIVKSDPMLYYRLLRHLNSALFGLQGDVKDLGQALIILGENEVRRWCQLSGMFEMSRNKPSDLVLGALVRARFAESIAARVDCGQANLFQVGLLSLMDAILDIPMRVVLEDMPMDEDERIVLLENRGPLSPVYELMLAVEAGAWPWIVTLSSELGIDQNFVAQSQWSAMEWAESVVTGS